MKTLAWFPETVHQSEAALVQTGQELGIGLVLVIRLGIKINCILAPAALGFGGPWLCRNRIWPNSDSGVSVVFFAYFPKFITCIALQPVQHQLVK